jgi:hypothetical protein
MATHGATQGATHTSGPKPHISAPSNFHTKRGGKMRAEAPNARDPPRPPPTNPLTTSPVGLPTLRKFGTSL